MGFTFSQPFLISRLLTLLEERGDDTGRMRGYGLIAATALIYTGIGVRDHIDFHDTHN